MANVLMVIAPERFRDEEVAETREVLTELGHDVELASTRTGRATGVRGSAVDVCHRLADVHGDAWDGVVFTGGPGMQALWDDMPADPEHKPPSIDGCHALKSDGPQVAKFFPRWHRS